MSDSATQWTAACQASLSITNSWSLLKLMSIESVMPSNHLILCHPLLLLPSLFPSIRVFSNESALHTRCPRYWSFRFSISPSKVQHLPMPSSCFPTWAALQLLAGISACSKTAGRRHEKVTDKVYLDWEVRALASLLAGLSE